MVQLEPKVWFSREDLPLQGFILVAKKQDVCVYDPWRVGKPLKASRDKPLEWSPDYLKRLYEGLATNCGFLDELFPGLKEVVGVE